MSSITDLLLAKASWLSANISPPTAVTSIVSIPGSIRGRPDNGIEPALGPPALTSDKCNALSALEA